MAPAQHRKLPRRAHRTITVLIADDHPVVRRGLKQILADTPDIAVAGEATNGREVLDHIRRDAYDVLCLDLTMPDSSGLDVLQALRHERPELPVLVLSMHPEDQYAVRVLKAGAAGYLTKDSAPEELVDAIRKVHAGGTYVSGRVAKNWSSIGSTARAGSHMKRCPIASTRCSAWSPRVCGPHKLLTRST